MGSGRPTSPPNAMPHNQLKNHPPPLGQRERSTSAPNVCYNLVGQPTDMSEDFLQRVVKGTYSTLHGNFHMEQHFILNLGVIKELVVKG